MQVRISFFLFICLFFSKLLSAQVDSTFTLRGIITIAETKATLPMVNVFNITSQKGSTSDENGNFEIKINSLPSLIQFTHIGYEVKALWLEKVEKNNLRVEMEVASTSLPDVIISAKPVIETITKPTYTVRDYVFYEDKILLATLPGLSKGNALVLINAEGEALDSLSLKGIRRFDFLHKSCTDKIHLVTETQVFEIALDSQGLRISHEHLRADFGRTVLPCVSATDSLFIFSFRYYIGQLLRFIAYAKSDSAHFVMAEVANDENLERRFREELSFSVGYIDYLDLSWEQKQMELRKAMLNNMELAGLIRLFYKPLDIPILNIGQQFVLFNHIHGKLDCFDAKGKEINSVPIQFQTEKSWDKKIIFDEFKQNVYTLFDHPKGKVLRQVHIEDGTLGSPVLIECAMVEQIKVHNGNLYYLESGRATTGYNRVLRKVSLTKF
jgi:CarboxypepD_reg-like domain